MATQTPSRALVVDAAKRATSADVRLAITGATGWLGLALTEVAMRAGLSPDNGRLRLFASSVRELTLSCNQVVGVEALADAPPLAGSGWTVAHFAGLGKERSRELSPAEFHSANDRILEHALRLANGSEGVRLIYSSSGAAYTAEPRKGQPPNPYAVMKLRQEDELKAWCDSTASPLTICRVFNVGGPFGNKLDLYALSSLVGDAVSGRPLEIQATRPIFRSYVHVEELVAVLLNAAARAELGHVTEFDTRGSEVVELGELACRICLCLGRSQGHIHRQFVPGAQPDTYVGKLSGYARALQLSGLYPMGLQEIILDTAADIGP